MSGFLLGVVAGCFVPEICKSISKNINEKEREEQAYYLRRAEQLCRLLNDNYDFSGTSEAEKNNKKLWRVYFPWFEELTMLPEYRMMYTSICCQHIQNLKTLRDNPGMFDKDKCYEQNFAGLTIFK